MNIMNNKTNIDKWINVKDTQGGVFSVNINNILAIMQFQCQAPNGECPIKVHRQIMIPIPSGYLEVSKGELIKIAKELGIEGFTLIPDESELGGVQ